MASAPSRPEFAAPYSGAGIVTTDRRPGDERLADPPERPEADPRDNNQRGPGVAVPVGRPVRQ